MLAFGIRPSPFHFGLLLNITHHCGLGSPESMHKLLLPAQRISLDDEETNAKEHKAYSGPSFLSGILTPDEQSRSILEQQQSSDSTEMISQQDASTSSEITSEWWQDATDIRQGHLLDTHLRPFSNASILKPSVSYEQKNLVALRMPRSPAERLMLLGGIPGVLKHMQEHKVAPNNIIFNTFLNVRVERQLSLNAAHSLFSWFHRWPNMNKRWFMFLTCVKWNRTFNSTTCSFNDVSVAEQNRKRW